MRTPNAIVLTAPESFSGKTTVTLGLLRALSRDGTGVRPAKSGPDYIDANYHFAACGSASVNLDAWSMDDDLLRSIAAGRPGRGSRESDPGYLIVEGSMGVVDGAGAAGTGSTAELAETLGAPLVMVIDASRKSHSAVLAALGLLAARPRVRLAGIIANRVGSDRHADMIRAAAEAHGLTVFGAIPRCSGLELPSRHLGLVPAGEFSRLEEFLAAASEAVREHVDVKRLLAAARPVRPPKTTRTDTGVQPLGQRIAVARDDAFCFLYAHLLAGWRRAGAEICFFSPLNDETPNADSDAVFLPGGYPELHGGTLAGSDRFKSGTRAAAADGAVVYGECGGYMALGKGLEDGDGNKHEMLGLLDHSASFKARRLHLGYRLLEARQGELFRGTYAAHEFHYASLCGGPEGQALFDAKDADGADLPAMGSVRKNVSGSFAHLICAVSAKP